MTEDDLRRRKLRDKLEADYSPRIESLKAELQRLEDERRQGHEWINGIPAPLLSIFTTNYDSALASQVIQGQTLSSSNGSSSEKQSRFKYMEAIIEILEAYDTETNISSNTMFEALKELYPEIRNHPKPVNVKSQVSSTLGLMEEKGLLTIYRKGGGSVPHLYRKVKDESRKDEIEPGGAVESIVKEEPQESLLTRVS